MAMKTDGGPGFGVFFFFLEKVPSSRSGCLAYATPAECDCASGDKQSDNVNAIPAGIPIPKSVSASEEGGEEKKKLILFPAVCWLFPNQGGLLGAAGDL